VQLHSLARVETDGQHSPRESLAREASIRSRARSAPAALECLATFRIALWPILLSLFSFPCFITMLTRPTDKSCCEPPQESIRPVGPGKTPTPGEQGRTTGSNTRVLNRFAPRSGVAQVPPSLEAERSPRDED
jgi:hypothetical protein